MSPDKGYITSGEQLNAPEFHQLLKDFELLKLHCSELEATNNHLISATWRERDLKKKLADTVDELNKTKVIVENQNRRITESINYARKIQLAINSNENDLKKHFPESFILYLPKDVISGDFPWVYTLSGYVYVAAVDCTGHGVPGAMMSMIGNLLLNDIANCEPALHPSEILSRLHRSVIHTLKQGSSENNSNDGMDICLSRFSQEKSELIFSGAHRPLFFMRDGKIETFPADKFPIGGMHYKNKNTYTDRSVRIEKGDTVYLFTDGFPDQIGGPAKTKLMVKNLKEFLERHPQLELKEMKHCLHQFMMEWKGDNKQIDDILLIGIRF